MFNKIIFFLFIMSFFFVIVIDAGTDYDNRFEKSMKMNEQAFYNTVNTVIRLIHSLISANNTEAERLRIQDLIEKRIVLARQILIMRDPIRNKGKKILNDQDSVIATNVKCQRCKNNKYLDPDCPACGGDGYGYTPDEALECKACKGTGSLNGADCPACSGLGWANSKPNFR